MLDFNHRPKIHELIGVLIDAALSADRDNQSRRNYLGASRLGVACERALQYEYLQTPVDAGREIRGRVLRIFEVGHALEELAIRWLRMAGFDLYTQKASGGQFGFSVAGGRIQGHVDGVLNGGPAELGMSYPALWECKTMNDKSWRDTVKHGVSKSKPVYAAQMAIYQAYMEASIPGISANPALFTAINKDSEEIWFELVPFDGGLAQRMSDRAVRVITATDSQELLPRHATTPTHVECKFCPWQGPLLGFDMMADNIIWLDFNDAPEQRDELASDTDALRAGLLDRLGAVLHYLFPQGRIRGGKFYVGDVDGNPGKSLVVELDGPRRGLWKDFSTDEGGDVIDLWARSQGRSARSDFPRIAGEIRQWLGLAPSNITPMRRDVRSVPMDDLGAYTAKWDYLSPEGELIACVYRYDPPTGKEYRPWDVRARMWRAPDPRPLYNLPVISRAREVVLVEGEKCAAALIACGIAATTAMNGAKAPVDKTDWHPLAGKSVVIWPDRDAPGWDYAESAARACVAAGSTSVAILVPPTDKPPKWDAADAVDEGFDCAAFIAQGERRVVKAAAPSLPTFTLDDNSPLPPDLISPRVLTPAGMLVFGGAPKVGKSDFLLSWLAHMAAGAAFLGMHSPRPLRVFYLQAEVQYYYLRERVKDVRLPSHRLLDARANFVATPQLRLVLDDAGLAQVIPAIAKAFGGEPPDIIAIDPIRNVFDGGDAGGENDNGAMLFFLSQRVERIRQAVNPDAGVILAHHTKKLGKKQFEEDPFQALAGAGSLRGYYSTGMLLFRPDETRTTRQLIFELRNGAGIPQRHVDKINGEWREVDANERLVMKDYGQRLDAERRRKRDAILQILFEEAGSGRCYTANQFAESFEGKAGLGGERTIRERVSALSTQGYIKYFRNAADYGLPSSGRTKFGYLCVESMVLRMPACDVDTATGELPMREHTVLPTHYKCPHSGASMPVENPDVWVYHDELNDPEAP